MSKEFITLDFSKDGKVKIEGHNYKGASCTQATAAFEKAHGRVKGSKKKAEFMQATAAVKQQASQ